MAKVNGGWMVIRSGAARATKVFDTQGEAIKYAKDVTRDHQSELVIHGKDGRLQEKTSYLSDPRPPKDSH